MSLSSPPAAAEPAPRSLGGLRDLFFFLLVAIILFLLVQLMAVYLLAAYARQETPDVSWPTLVEQVMRRHQFDAFFAVPVQFVYYTLLVSVLYALVRGHRDLPFWSSLGFRSFPLSQLLPALAAGALLALSINLSNLLVPPPESLAIERLFTTRAAALLIIAASLFVAPFVEELIFRGYIYTLLERLWGTTPAVLASGLLFGSIHFPQLWPGYFQMVLLCVVGVVFSLARARTGTIVASIVVHLGYNATISLWFLLSSSFRTLPASF